MKALEQEVLQLKNDISILSSGYEGLETGNQQLKENLDTLSASNARLEDENRQLRQLLEQHGASWPDSRTVGHLTRLPESSSQALNPPTVQAENMTTSPMPIQAGSQIQAG